MSFIIEYVSHLSVTSLKKTSADPTPIYRLIWLKVILNSSNKFVYVVVSANDDCFNYIFDYPHQLCQNIEPCNVQVTKDLTNIIMNIFSQCTEPHFNILNQFPTNNTEFVPIYKQYMQRQRLLVKFVLTICE